MRSQGRQRISASVALLHPFFDPGAPTLLQRVRLGLLRLVNRDNTELSRALVQFIARSDSQEVAGGLTEVSLQKFRVSPAPQAGLALPLPLLQGS